MSIGFRITSPLASLFFCFKNRSERKGMGTLGRIPKDHLSVIVGFLAPEDLARLACSSRYWRRLTSKDALWNTLNLPWLKIINEQVWKTYVDLEAYGLDATGAAPLPHKRALMRILYPLSRRVDKSAGITL